MYSIREKKNFGVCVCMSRGESEGKKVKVKNVINFLFFFFNNLIVWIIL